MHSKRNEERELWKGDLMLNFDKLPKLILKQVKNLMFKTMHKLELK